MFTFSDIQKRFLLFLFGCIPTRLLLANIVYYSSKHEYLRIIMGMITLIISLGFLSIFIFGLREKGTETFGKPIWWNSLRPIHSIIYGFVAYNLLFVWSKHSVYLERNLLVFDALIGLGAFIIFHTYNGDIWKLF